MTHDTLTPLPIAVQHTAQGLESAGHALNVLLAALPGWAEPYIYGAAGHPSSQPRRLRIGIICRNEGQVIEVGDALFAYDPDFVRLGQGDAEVHCMVRGTPVIAWCSKAVA